MLRNPNLVIGGVTSFPNNAYDIDMRRITPVDADYVNVEIFLNRYASSSKTNKIDLNPPIYFVLKNLPNDPALLNPPLYQSELLTQHGDEIVDGTALSNFTVL
jgi:hypothetical protein